MSKEKDYNLLEQTAADMNDFCRLQWDKYKLRLLDNLSTFLNGVFSILIVVLLGMIALLFVGVALVIALEELTGSFLWAAVIMAGVFIIAAVIVYLCRKTLMVNPMVRMLGKMMFEHDKTDDYD